MSVIVETNALTRRFGAVAAVDGVTLSLEAGAPIGLVGPNGAGKTTFFSMLCGFLLPTSGSVRVFGRPPLHPDLYGRVAILPQDAAFVRTVPVVTQLRFFAELQGFSGAAALTEARRVLSLVLLDDAAHKPPESMSHGMLKRVAIAQTFIGSPELVLLDEPTAGLDPASATNIKNVVRALAAERTFIVSSHNLPDIEELCGSIVVLGKGKVSRHSTVAELVGRASCLTFRLEQDAPPGVDKIFADVPGVERVERGATGERRLRVHFVAEGPGQSATEIAVIQVLAKAGIVFVEMTRGQSLEDQVIALGRTGAARPS
jgi:ABC-2 type transport system ATP-binding protein